MHQKSLCLKQDLDSRTVAVGIPYYFSENLNRKIEIFAMSKAALIEAPSGYGKTTAMREYLKGADPGEAVYWFTAVDEAPTALYRRFCHEVEKIDSNTGARLLEIDFPNAFTMGEVCDAFRSITCARKAWLIIDDFQHILNIFPKQALVALLGHGADKLRIVVITQTLGSDFLSGVAGLGIPHLKASDLQWDTFDIHKYFEIAGAPIPQEIAAEVEKHTNGWVLAVRLQLCSWKEGKALSDKAVYKLMEQLIWHNMTKEQKAALMMASTLKTFTVSQLCMLLDCIELSDPVMEALSIPFIRYVTETHQYEAHAILHALITTKRKEMGDAFEKECIKKAGDMYRSEGKIVQALNFYSQIHDYERILSLDLAKYTFAEFGEKTFYEIALEIAQNCPREVGLSYPLSMLHVAWGIRLMDGDGDDFAKIMNDLDNVLPEKGLLRAEWLLLCTYLHFPDLRKMLYFARAAEKMFEGAHSKVILPQTPWAFYEYLQLTAFHITVGKAEDSADILEQFINIYSPITRGHGNGADALYRAELAFYKCETTQAEIFAYKAAFLAESRSQKNIQIGAARLLASIAIFKADEEGWKHALSAIEQAALGTVQNTKIFRAALDVVRGTLLAEIRDFDRLAAWLKNADFVSSYMPRSIKKNALAVHMIYLINQGDYARLVGLGQSLTFEKYTVVSEYIHALLMSVGLLSIGERAQASKALEHSAQVALQDHLLHYFAGFSRLLRGLSDELIEREYPEHFQKFKDHKVQYLAGWKLLHNAIVAGTVPFGLTEREREIAQLAADGMRNHEIAEALFVSENTVRAHLRAIYQKLDIDRRAKLVKVLK